MTSRIVLPLTTAMLAYQASVVLALILSMGLNPVSITRGILFAMMFGGMMVALWLKPLMGRWAVAAFFAVKVWVYASSGARFDSAPTELAMNAVMTALCAGLIYALFRTEFPASLKALELSSRA